MMSEPVFNFMNFIQENAASMNDADFNDAFNILASRLENDSYRRMNLVSLEKTLGFQQIKKYIQSNFDRISGDNFTLQNLLYLFTELALKNKATILFTPEQIRRVIDASFANLENNHAKLSLPALLNVISLLGSSRNVLAHEYLRSRSEEVSGLGFSLMNRILRRCTNERVGEGVRDSLNRLLTAEMMNISASEKMINKCRAFNTVAKLDHVSPFNSFNRGKLGQLLKDIRSQAENHDQQSILLMIEALNFFDDATRNDTLKEFYDIVTMTIKHQPENVKLDFVIRFIEFSGQLKQDNALNTEHAKTIVDYVVGAIANAGENTKRLPPSSQFVPIFNFMRKGKLFDKEITEKILTHIAPYVSRFGNNIDIRPMKAMINKVMGEEFLTEYEGRAIEDISNDFNNRPDQNPLGLINLLGKLGKFNTKNNETAHKMFTAIFERLDELFKGDRINIFTLINRYLNEVQEFLPSHYRQIMTEKFVNRVSPAEIANYRNPVLVMSYISDLYNKDNEELRAKTTELINNTVSDPRFKKNLVPTLLKLCREQSHNLSNNSIYKFVGYIREYGKDPQFVTETPKFFDKLLFSSFYLVYNQERDSPYTIEAASSLLNVADFVHSKNSEVVIDIFRSRVPIMLKAFERAKLNSQILNRSLVGYLNSSRDLERSFLSIDTVLVLDRLLRSDVVNETELEEILKRFIPNEEKAAALLNAQNAVPQKITLIKLYANINKKRLNVISDDYARSLKNFLIENVIKGSLPENIKLMGLFALSSFKNNVVDYNNDNKELNALIKSVFAESNLKKIYRFIDQLSLNRTLKLNRRFYVEFANLYEKEENIEKYLLMRIVDKFSNYGWNYSGFFNKIISDYERLFDSFTSTEHANLIGCFARVELDKEDVIRAGVKNINTKQLNESAKFDLFNDLVKMGFTGQEWRELILEKLVQETDFGYALFKAIPRERVNFLNNLWKLSNWPSNNKDLINLVVTQLKKKPKNLEKQRTVEEDWVLLIRRNPNFTSLDAEIQTAFDSVFDIRVENDKRKPINFYLQEYLKSMGHSELEFEPKNVLCDILIPETKQAILIAGRQYISIVTNDLNSTAQFAVSQLKEQGYTPIVVNYNSFNEMINKEKSHHDFVQYLGSLGIILSLFI
jgi:hypothetical protein